MTPEPSKSMEKRLLAQRGGPIVLADIEHTFAGDRAPDVLALCAALRSAYLYSGTHPLHRADLNTILARHNIVLGDREGT